MILEGLVVAACFAGNTEACNSSLTGYVKYNKLDERAQVIEENVKKKYPAVHFTGVTLGTVAYKKYNFLLCKNTWLQLDYSTSEKISKIVYKIEF